MEKKEEGPVAQGLDLDLIEYALEMADDCDRSHKDEAKVKAAWGVLARLRALEARSSSHPPSSDLREAAEPGAKAYFEYKDGPSLEVIYASPKPLKEARVAVLNVLNSLDFGHHGLAKDYAYSALKAVYEAITLAATPKPLVGAREALEALRADIEARVSLRGEYWDNFREGQVDGIDQAIQALTRTGNQAKEEPRA